MSAKVLQSMLSRVAADGIGITTYGVTVTSGGRFQDAKTKLRISRETAIQMLTEGMTTTAAPAPQTKHPKRTNFSWDSLNGDTRIFFFALCEQIQEATRDHAMMVPARLGTDIPSIGLVNAPRLTNLKKAKVIETVQGEKKTHRMIRLTDAGRAIWFEHTGASH